MKLDTILISFSEWIYRFLKLNFLWVLFSTIGGIVFGVMPATIAMFYILRKWVQGELEISIFKTFKDVYIKEFKNSNKCGLCFGAIFMFLAIDLNILYKMDELYSTVLYIIVMSVLFFVSIAFIYFFPTYVHFELTLKEYIKNAFILSLSSPVQTLMIGVGFGLVYYFVQGSPGLIPFFFVVVPAYWVMHILYKRFLYLKKVQSV
ncbi:MAG: YesL family protein [Romboutsia sp.]